MNVVKVLVSDIVLQHEENVITPTRRVRLILENGMIFDRSFFAFNIDQTWVVNNFETEEEKWSKLCQ